MLAVLVTTSHTLNSNSQELLSLRSASGGPGRVPENEDISGSEA